MAEFSILVAGTVVITRIWLYMRPRASPTILGFRLHHYMFGLVGIVAGLVLHMLAVYAIGMGLFIDEVTFLLIGGRTHEDNYSKASLAGTALLVCLTIALSRYLAIPFGY